MEVIFMAQKMTVPVFDEKDIQDNKIICAISYLWILFFLPLVACPNSAYGKFTANQALLLFIAGVIIGVVGIIPILGTIVSIVGGIALFIITILQFVATIQGKVRVVPFIGHIQIIK